MYRFVYLSIDPGTSHLGTTLNAITEDNQWCVLHTTTTNVAALVYHKYPKHLIELYGERFFKSKVCEEVVYNFATAWQVNQIVSESPYMGRFPQAFAALTECLTMIKNAAYHHNPNVPLHLIDPATIKNHVGVKGNSGDKNKMTDAVARLTGTSYNLQHLDEHGIDSIAVGYAWYRSIWLGLPKG